MDEEASRHPEPGARTSSGTLEAIGGRSLSAVANDALREASRWRRTAGRSCTSSSRYAQRSSRGWNDQCSAYFIAAPCSGLLRSRACLRHCCPKAQTLRSPSPFRSGCWAYPRRSGPAGRCRSRLGRWRCRTVVWSRPWCPSRYDRALALLFDDVLVPTPSGGKSGSSVDSPRGGTSGASNAFLFASTTAALPSPAPGVSGAQPCSFASTRP